MRSYRLLVVDVDGTLLDKKGAISAEDRKALAQVRESGILLVLSTGRATMACRRIIEQLSLDGHHIFFDGALVSNVEREDEVFAQPINPAVVRQMIDFAHEHEIDLELTRWGIISPRGRRGQPKPTASSLALSRLSWILVVSQRG